MARISAAALPPVEPPRPVKPFVHFARLPEQALVAVRRALDEDEEFRARVATLADEGELGRAGWLFVTRPEGWEAELSELAVEAERRASAEREERDERSARRRLASAEAATRRAEDAATRARAEAAKAAAELAVERRERRAAQDEAAVLARRVASLEGERDSARRRAAEATAEADRLRARSEELSDVDVAAVAKAVGDAVAAAASVSRSLQEASAALAASSTTEGGERLASAAVPPVRPTAADPALAPPDGPRRPRGVSAGAAPRRPTALPPAVFDDTTEAANHLVRVPGMLVLVDGYNAAKALWPDVTPLELRERLVDALSELEARTGAGIHVVFDGADLGGPQARLPVRRGVRVTFSPPGVEADDVILDLVEEMPLERPVVVSSSDRRVQEGARMRGASVISSPQLAAVLGRA